MARIIGIVLTALFHLTLLSVQPSFAAKAEYPLPETLPFGSYRASQKVGDSSFKLSSMYVLDLGRNDPTSIIIALVNIVLTFLGFAGMVVLVYAGILWATARGNSEQVDKAKNLIRRSATGLVIILMASAINILIFYLIQTQFIQK